MQVKDADRVPANNQRAVTGAGPWWIYTPVLLAVLIMLPRLLSPQFGLFDDGTTILTSQQIASGHWDPAMEAGSGRFRPVYWLYYGLIYLLAGKSPLAFFAGNLLLLALTAAILIALVRRAGGSRWQAFLAGLLFALSGPVIEAYYTLSKPEPVQLLALALALLALVEFYRARGTRRRGMALLGALLATLLAALTKETTLILIPISAAWAGLAWIDLTRRKSLPVVVKSTRPDQNGLRASLAMLAASLAAGLAFVALRAIYIGGKVPPGGYASNYIFSRQQIASSAFRWAGWLVRDFPYLLALVLVVVILLVARRRLSLLPYWDALVWMAAWIIGYLPWKYTQEYYLLPFAAGAAVFGGLAAGSVSDHLAGLKSPARALVWAGMVLAGLLLLLTLPANFSNARLQLAVDATNSRMVAYLASHVPPGGEVQVNLLEASEYIPEIGLHLAVLYGRPDIAVIAFNQQAPGAAVKNENAGLLVSPGIEHMPLLSVRLGVYELTNIELNQQLKAYLGDQSTPVATFETSIGQFNLDWLRLACPLFKKRTFCAISSPVLETRPLHYWWEVYPVRSVNR